MATCPRCGSPAPDEDRFCRNCGGYLTTPSSGPEGDTQQLPTQEPPEPRPPGIPAIDDASTGPVPHQPGGDAFETARLPMGAYPVEQPGTDDWVDAPDQGWYQDEAGGQAPPPPGQGFPPVPPYEQRQPDTGPPPFPQQQPPPFGQAPPYGQAPPFGQAPPQYGPPEGGGYEGAAYYPYDETPGKKGNGGRTAIIAVVGAIAVVALVFGGVLFVGSRNDKTADAGSTTSASASRQRTSASPSASASPSSSTNTPQQQAVAVNKLLDRAVSGKSLLASAYEDALACKISPADAATQFELAAKNRRAIVTSAKKLDTSKLANGTRIKQLLVSMYSTSAKADDAFAAWARAGDNAGASCLKGNAKRAKGNSLSIKAGRQKKSFTKVWNPVARTYGQPKRTKNRL